MNENRRKRRHKFRVEMYAAIPYTVEVEAANRREAMSVAEHELPIPPEQMQLPALYVQTLGCELIRTRRKSDRAGD